MTQVNDVVSRFYGLRTKGSVGRHSCTSARWRPVNPDCPSDDPRRPFLKGGPTFLLSFFGVEEERVRDLRQTL